MSKRLRRSEWQVLKSVYNYLKEVNAFKKKVLRCHEKG